MERKLISEADSRPLVVLDPRAPASQDALDASVRAAASLTVHFARKTGCGLLLPGDRRAVTIDPDLLAWPQAHVRLALIEDAAGPGARGRAEPPRARRLRRRARRRPAAARARPHAGRLPDRRARARSRAAARCSRSPAARASSRAARAPRPRWPRWGRGMTARRTRGAAATSTARVHRRRPRRSARRPPRAGRCCRCGSRAAACCSASRVRRAALGRDARPGRARRARGRRSGSPRSSSPRCSRAARLPRALRWLAAAATRVAAVALALLAGGLADEYLRPERWSELLAGASRGFEALPGVNVPYRGIDEWTRLGARRGRHAARRRRGAARVLAAARRAPASPPPRCSRS